MSLDHIQDIKCRIFGGVPVERSFICLFESSKQLSNILLTDSETQSTELKHQPGHADYSDLLKSILFIKNTFVGHSSHMIQKTHLKLRQKLKCL